MFAASATLTTTHDTHDGSSCARCLDPSFDTPLYSTSPLSARRSYRADQRDARGAFGVSLPPFAPLERGVSMPTEEALRAHNEMQVHDATAAAAAVLARLPVVGPCDLDDDMLSVPISPHTSEDARHAAPFSGTPFRGDAPLSM